MEEILSLARKEAQEAEVFLVSSEETQVHFEANRLKQLQTRQKDSVSLRVVKDGRIGYATATLLDNAAELVRNAVETAQFGTVAKFRFPEKTVYPQVDVFDDSVNAVTIDNMIELGTAMIDTVLAHTTDIICDAGTNRGTVSVRIANTKGGEAEYHKSFFSLGLEGSLINGTDMLFVGESQGSCHPLLDPALITGDVLRQLELAKDRAAVPTRPLPVIFTPTGVASALIFSLMSAFNGKSVLEGASPIGEKLGWQVFDEKLSLWDDATLAYRPASRPCDDEGVPSRRTPLIERGVVSGFLYDLQTAARAGAESTGNGERGNGLPAPSPSAFVIAPGGASFEEMLADIKEGLVIEHLMGASQGNVLGGEFSGNVLLGYKVENGKIVGRVKDTMVSGNVYELLKEINAVGKEAKWVGGSLLTPPIYCPRLSVASKG